LRRLGLAQDDEDIARHGHERRGGHTAAPAPSGSGHLAAPAPGGHTGDTGHDPSTACFHAELTELENRYHAEASGEEGGEKEALRPEEIRRIAELQEFLHGEEAACRWWILAAEEGDELATYTCRELGLPRGGKARPAAQHARH